MEKSTRELESQVAAQEKQIARYESRLKDVVAAYKGLLKEKEALEAALSGSSAASDTPKSANAATTAASNQPDPAKPASIATNPTEDLNKQIATLMNSLATLSGEKSRMEASFQADKRQLRTQLAGRDQLVRELQDKCKSLATANQLEVEKVKSKLIIERHARDNQIGDHMAMVKELQKLLSDERHLKEHLEMQLNDLKHHVAQFDSADARVAELRAELDASRRKYKELKSSARSALATTTASHSTTAATEAASAACAAQLQQLQSDMESLRLQTLRTVSAEQKRAQSAEERAKRMAAVHEERVVTLEARLAELSGTVGRYDRLRQSDQEQIFRLKAHVAQLEANSATANATALATSTGGASPPPASREIDDMIEEVYQLKKLLLLENARQTAPRDLSKLFATGNDHRDCSEAYDKLLARFELANREAEPLLATVETQQRHMRTLQDKIQVLNQNIDAQEQELKHKSSAHYAELRAERAKWKELVGAMELDFRGKVADLEVQLQKQRERSLRLLEEKELEIKGARQQLEQVFGAAVAEAGGLAADGDAVVADAATRRKISASSPDAGSGSAAAAAATSECHMLHYVHELARKEVEITALRRAKNSAEAAMRQALQDKVTSQQELHDRIGDLDAQVDRLERCKSRESANLEYLKNVVLSFLVAGDTDSRGHMVNAIGAVLQFSPAELKTVANYLAARK